MITTVIPTFRRPTMLPIAVRSALSQTWRDLSVCIFDNASGDDTPEVAAQLMASDSRVSFHRHPENLGPHRNFTFGVRAVETPFFSILADDDVMLPDFYRRAMSAFLEHRGAMFVAMTALHVDESSTVRSGTGTANTSESRFCAAGEAYGRFPGNWTGWVFRRDVVDAIGFIREEAGPAADIGFLRHVTARFPGVILPDIAALIRVHSGNASDDATLHLKSDRRWWDALSRRLEDDEEVPAWIRSSVRSSIERMYVGALRRSVATSLIDGQSEFAIETTRILKTLGYQASATVLRAVIACYPHVPFAERAIRHLGRHRRDQQRQDRREFGRRFESRRPEFLALLNGTAQAPPR